MKKANSNNIKTSNYLLGALIIQNSITVLVARHVSTTYNYDVRKLLIIAELVKLFLSCSMEAYTLRKKHSTNPNGYDNDNVNSGLISSLHQHIWLNPLDALKLSLPALLYALQNILAFTAISIVPVPLFLIVQQTKLVKTTLLSILLLKRSYSVIQWISILSLILGSSICFFSVIYEKEENKMDIQPTQFHIFGVLLVLASNFSASLAGVYFELVIKGVDKKTDDTVVRNHDNNNDDDHDDTEKETLLSNEIDDDDDDGYEMVSINVDDEEQFKKRSSSHQAVNTTNVETAIDEFELDKESFDDGVVQNESELVQLKTETSTSMAQVKDQPSIWMRNIQLGFFSLCIIILDIMIEESKIKNPTPIIGGEFHVIVLIQILLFAFGGLLIAAVIKNADNVQKGLCMGMSVVLTCIISMVMDKSFDGVSIQFIEGAIFAIGGCFFFANSTLVSFNRRNIALFVMFLCVMIVTIITRNHLIIWH